MAACCWDHTCGRKLVLVSSLSRTWPVFHTGLIVRMVTGFFIHSWRPILSASVVSFVIDGTLYGHDFIQPLRYAPNGRFCLHRETFPGLVLTLPYLTTPRRTIHGLTRPNLTASLPYQTKPHLTRPHLTGPHHTPPYLTIPNPYQTTPHRTVPNRISPHLTQSSCGFLAQKLLKYAAKHF